MSTSWPTGGSCSPATRPWPSNWSATATPTSKRRRRPGKGHERCQPTPPADGPAGRRAGPPTRLAPASARRGLVLAGRPRFSHGQGRSLEVPPGRAHPGGAVPAGRRGAEQEPVHRPPGAMGRRLRRPATGVRQWPFRRAALGAGVQIPAHCTLERPIHLVFLADPGAAPLAAHPRSLIQLGAGSHASLVESHVAIGAGVYLSNALSQVVLEAGAELEHYSLQDASRSAFHLARLDVRQARDSRFSAHLTACGGAIARHEVRVALEGPGAQVTLDGLYLPGGEQHLDNQTCIEHLAPYCTSRERYKGVIGGRGHGVFDGRIIVRPGAIKTDASQTIKNLLLSATAQANAQPRLEIFADDVKCAHGAAVGQLDRQAIFYLRSRGLDEPAARALLTYAFVGEMLEAIRLAPLRSRGDRLVPARLRGLEVTP